MIIFDIRIGAMMIMNDLKNHDNVCTALAALLHPRICTPGLPALLPLHDLYVTE